MSLCIVVRVLLCNAIQLYLSLSLDTRWVTMSAVLLDIKLSKSFFSFKIIFLYLAFRPFRLKQKSSSLMENYV